MAYKYSSLEDVSVNLALRGLINWCTTAISSHNMDTEMGNWKREMGRNWSVNN